MTPLIFGLGPTEIGFLVVALLVLFGGKAIPSLMKGLGQGIREFKVAKKEITSTIEEASKDLKE
jgi:sec-independent protein translocase protein TatA